MDIKTSSKPLDLTFPLGQTEASRAKTIFEQKGIRLKYRMLIGFTPAQISAMAKAESISITPEEIAKAAGR